MLRELRLVIQLSVIYSDNQGCLRIVQNKASQGRTKHIDLRLQYMKEAILNKEVLVRFVRSQDNIADIFIKPLGRLNFVKLRAFLVGP